MNLHECVPVDKFDEVSAHKAVAIGYKNLFPVLEDILEWAQDYNWPVADILNPLYFEADEDLNPYLLNIFSTKDYQWQYWIMVKILPQIKPNSLNVFIPILKRISQNPTDEEKIEKLDETALECLTELNSNA
ncbi:MAG: hypothetical protein COA79_26485 [Planctomycetota bacterium]|nr:MAG: hypothetical protein COA79_26485 [Planctomycetota bacterium]